MKFSECLSKKYVLKANSAGIEDMLGSAAREAESPLSDIMSGESIEEIGDGLIKFLSPSEIFANIIGVGEGAFKSVATLFCVIVGLLLLCCVCTRVSEGMTNSGMSAGVTFLGSAVLCAGVFASTSGTFLTVSAFFERLGSLMNSMIPIFGTVLAMGGNVSGASVSTVTLYCMLALTQSVCASAVLPVCGIMGATAICSGLSGGALLDGFCGAVKKIYNFILGAVMSIFVFVLGAQTVVATSADTLAARTGKFLSSVAIPGVGGAVGETIRTLAGSVGYIKSVVGIGGILMLALLTLPVLIELLLIRIVFLITSAIAGMLGCSFASRLLSEMGSIYGFLIGTVSICTVAFIIAAAIFIRCAVAME